MTTELREFIYNDKPRTIWICGEDENYVRGFDISDYKINEPLKKLVNICLHFFENYPQEEEIIEACFYPYYKQFSKSKIKTKSKEENVLVNRRLKFI